MFPLSVRLEPEPEKESGFWFCLFVFLINELSCQDFWVEKDRTR